MEEIGRGHRTIHLHDVIEIVRNPNSGFDPEPVTISQIFAKNTKRFGTYPAIVSKEGKIYSYKDYYDNAEMFSKSLVALGLQMFDVICVLGFTSPEYLFSLQGSWLIGCVTAGILQQTRQRHVITFLTMQMRRSAYAKEERMLPRLLPFGGHFQI